MTETNKLKRFEILLDSLIKQQVKMKKFAKLLEKNSTNLYYYFGMLDMMQICINNLERILKDPKGDK